MDDESGYRPRRERIVYDGKRMRKAVVRKTVDYNASAMEYLWNRPHYSNYYRPVLQPTEDFFKCFELQTVYRHQPAWGMCTKFVHISVNKVRTPINCVTFTPDARRVITGTHSGEFTIWNGLTFNFETILQAHNEPIRRMLWTHNAMFLVSSCDAGIVKYWQSSMNNVQAFAAHKESVRDLAFAPSDLKFATACDDQTIGLFDFETRRREQTLTGHRWVVRTIDWHPHKSLLISGSKDNSIKFWDPKAGKEIGSIAAHKHTVTQVRWNRNGMWCVSVGRDNLAKIWDIRKLNQPLICRGHPKEITAVSWHPQIEQLFATGGFEGNVKYWVVGDNTFQAEICGAHDGSVWDMAWHPLGHLLVTGSNDHTTRWWTRNRPGDEMDDKYNANQLPAEERKEALEALAQMARLNPRQPQMAALQGYVIDDDEQGGILQDEQIKLPGLDNLDDINVKKEEIVKAFDANLKRKKVMKDAPDNNAPVIPTPDAYSYSLKMAAQMPPQMYADPYGNSAHKINATKQMFPPGYVQQNIHPNHAPQMHPGMMQQPNIHPSRMQQINPGIMPQHIHPDRIQNMHMTPIQQHIHPDRVKHVQVKQEDEDKSKKKMRLSSFV